MASKILKTVIILLFFLFPHYSAQAIEPLSIVINEITWMGTGNSVNDEWIELYNNSNENINLKGWGIYEQGGKVLIESLTGVIKSKSYYLIERTDDETVAGIEASQKPSGWGGYGLNNKGEHLQLLNNNSNLIDEVNCKDGWFAGDNKTKQTMERINSSISGNDSSNWQTSQNPGGTPKKKNYELRIKNQKTKEKIKPIIDANDVDVGHLHSPTQLPKIESKSASYPTGIVFSEVLPSPKGLDTKDEWIELKNINDKEADISGWKIQDTVGSIKTYIFSKGTKIQRNSYLVVTRPLSKITLNNNGDGLKLIQPNEQVIDSVNYQKAPQGQSYNKTESGWFWSIILTPGKENIIKSEAVSLLKKKSTETLSLSEDFSHEEGTAAIGKKLSKSSYRYINKRGLSIFLIALILAIFSGIMTLILKKKFPKKNS